MSHHLRMLDPSFGDNFETAVRRLFSPSFLDAEMTPLKMRIDVAETPTAFTVRADIPGARREDISVRVEGNVVLIEAETHDEKEAREDGGKVLRAERHFGTLQRSFSLGQDIDAERVQAKYTDGVLRLELPKKGPSDARRINVA